MKLINLLIINISMPHKQISKFIKEKILKRSKLFDILKPRTNAPPKIRKWIEENRSRLINKIVVCRKPVQSAVKSLLDIISFGKFSKSLKGLHYDNIFHLYIYITLGKTTWRIEKNEVVTLVEDNRDIDEDCIDITINKRIKLGMFMKKGELYQKDFWSYDPKSNNCQDFAFSLMIGNNLITHSGQITFIKQDAEAIFKNNPEYLAKIGKTFTDIAGIFDVLKEGK